ncbi:hypothetical protein Csa_013378, partial [Cucumis sativus]
MASRVDVAPPKEEGNKRRDVAATHCPIIVTPSCERATQRCMVISSKPCGSNVISIAPN